MAVEEVWGVADLQITGPKCGPGSHTTDGILARIHLILANGGIYI